MSADRYGTLSLTPDGRDVMRGRRPELSTLADLAALRESLGRDDEDDDFEMEKLRRRPTRRWR